MTPLFAPKPPPPGANFGPGFGERRRAQEIFRQEWGHGQPHGPVAWTSPTAASVPSTWPWPSPGPAVMAPELQHQPQFPVASPVYGYTGTPPFGPGFAEVDPWSAYPGTRPSWPGPFGWAAR